MVKKGKMADFNRALLGLKLEVFDRSGLVLIEEESLRMLAAWPLVTTWTAEFETDLPEPWNMVGWDHTEWARLAHLPLEAVLSKWRGLIDAGLIYPDNTLNPTVEKYLIERADDISPKTKEKETKPKSRRGQEINA